LAISGRDEQNRILGTRLSRRANREGFMGLGMSPVQLLIILVIVLIAIAAVLAISVVVTLLVTVLTFLVASRLMARGRDAR